VGASPWIILFAIFVYGVIHSWLASNQAKALARGWFGEAAERGYRLGYNVFAGVTLLPVLALPALLPDRQLYALQAPWLWAAVAVQGLALAALVIGLWHTGVWAFLGIEQLFQPQPNVNTKLVVRGLYRWVRHPLYTAGLAFIWFSPVMTTNLLVLNLGLTAYILIGARFEERKLRREFGEAYAEYQRRTPMLVPRLGRRASLQ
jgi:methanethiol S-methyltransferase